MRIIQVFASYPNLQQPYNIKLIERLNKSDIDCKVFTFKKQKKIKQIKTLEHYRFSWFIYLFRVLFNFKKFIFFKKNTVDNLKGSVYTFGRYWPLFESNSDLIHIHHIQLLNKKFLNFLNCFKFKIVISLRGSDILVRPFRSKDEFNFVNNIFRSIGNIHTVSNHMKHFVENNFEYKGEIYPIRRTVEVDQIKNFKESKGKIIKISTIGRIHWTKGYLDAIRALNILNKKNIKFEYNICGSYNLDQFDELNFWILKYNLKDKINFLGHLDSKKLNEVLADTAIYLQTSLTEGIPNSLLRALIYNIPTVTSSAGGIPEVFENEKDGYIVDVGDYQKIGLALEKLIINKECREKIRAGGSNVRVDFKEEINCYIDMYNSIIV